MEEKLSVKINAIEVLEKQLANRAKKNQHGIIVLSSATEPYLQVEKDLQVTRKMLEVILHYKFPVHIITKSDLVLRDTDLLTKINQDAILPADLQPYLSHKVFVTFSFSTLDDTVAKTFEPGATPPSLRLKTIIRILSHGFHSGVSLMPLIPFISDSDEQLDSMFKAFREINANYIFPASLTLFGNGPYDSKTLMFNAIEKHYPTLIEKYKKLYAFSFQPPSWYRDSLHNKVESLSKAYGLKNKLT
jgi:DNA repair photolyase